MLDQDRTVLVSAHDVATELRRRLGPRLGTTKLHKLLYYAQGWHLAWAGEPLFGEPVHAWANGPVVARLWADEKHGRPRPAATALDGDQLATIELVVDRYGRLDAGELIRRTHGEGPWLAASQADDPSPEIGADDLRRWFTGTDEHRRREAAVEALRARTDVYSFGGAPSPPGLGAAVTRALRGERVHDRRPG